jgi:transposase
VKATAPEPHVGLQGEGGAGRYQGQSHLTQLAEQFDACPYRATAWKAQLEGGAADVFGVGGGSAAAEPAVDVKSLHAKLGKLTLENEFLDSALTKAAKSARPQNGR